MVQQVVRESGVDQFSYFDSLVDLENGLSLADLGKSCGYRTIVVYRERKRATFLYGFAKNEKGNIASKEFLSEIGR